MAGKTSIEWAEHSWNPLAGCSVLSPGCTNCFAMRLAKRLAAMGNPLYRGLTKDTGGGAVWTGLMTKAPRHTLLEPLRRQKPTTYFVNSMSDLFHENVPDAWIDQIFMVMAGAPRHTFQILTKRAERMQRYMQALLGGPIPVLPLPNVWLGVSTERQKEADERIPLLLQTRAAVRFISAEPLLGPINLDRIHEGFVSPEGASVDMWESCLTGKRYDMWAGDDEDPMQPGHPKLDWVIVGGESGNGYRPMAAEWAKSIIDQCTAADVPVFMKQMAGKKTIPPELSIRQFPPTQTQGDLL